MSKSTIKKIYVSPVVETMTVRVERGFQGSSAPSGVEGSASTSSYGEGATWN